jgi:predicted kinase/predicted phosphodiesterase
MKKLIILRGIQGSGKSTFIKENNLQNHTLSPDIFRVMLSGHSRTNDGEIQVCQQESIKAWKMTFDSLETRMNYDLLTLIDATHCNIRDLNQYLELANKYEYKIYVLDFDISWEEAVDRNNSRPLVQKMPLHILEKFYTNLQVAKKSNLSKEFTLLSKENWKKELLQDYIINVSDYKDIYFIGDLQGTYQPIKDFFNDHEYDKKNLYIFVGDYVDRGIENHLAVQFVTDNQKSNYIFCNGNHEFHLHCWAHDLEIKSTDFIYNTKPQLEEANISKELVKKALKKMKEFVILKTEDKEIIVSHCGLPFFPSEDDLLFMQGNELSYKREYKFPVDTTFANNTKENQFQLHGHRNPEKAENNDQIRSFALEDNVEYGGYLRIAKLSNNEFTFLKYKNNVVKNIVKTPLLKSLSNNDMIHEKMLADGIFSYNFSREAFYKKEWNDLTTKARGLFIHKESSTIVARSFDKFFNIGEFDHCSLKSLSKMKFPVDIFLKDNGFLGILGHTPFKKELLFCSKSTNEGDFAGYFKSIFMNDYMNQETKINSYLAEHNCSMVFEVIDVKNDPHIIEYKENQIVLLDVIYNTSDFDHVSYSDLCKIAEMFNFKVKEKFRTINNYEDFVLFYNEVTTKDYLYNGISPIEGFVIEDQEKYMVKIKCHYYNYWKGFRRFTQLMAKGKLNTVEDIHKLPKLDNEQKEILVSILQNNLFNLSNIDIQKALLSNNYKANF